MLTNKEERLDGQQENALIEEATAVRERAYVPYSGFAVGAALVDEAGQVFSGCNVENVSYGLSSCAERNAIFAAVGQGARRVVAVAVVTSADAPTPPCGACRQVLLEFAADGDMDVVMATTAGDRRATRLSALLPEGFSSFKPDNPG